MYSKLSRKFDVWLSWFRMMFELKYSDYINELVLYFDADIEKKSPLFIRCMNKLIWMSIFVIPTSFAYFIYASFLLFIPRHSHNEITKGLQICVSRSFATSSKLNFLRDENVIFFSERPRDMKSGHNIYALPFWRRVHVILKSISVFLRDSIALCRDVSCYLSWKASIRALMFYFTRLPHKVGFESHLEYLVKLYQPRRLITGNKEDRYALVEQRVSKHLQIPLVCYPHGLEYAMKLPRGVVGDVFYCLSAATQLHYRNLYKNFGQEFIFSESISRKMLGRKLKGRVTKRNVVFFPESRGVEVNQRIVKALFEHEVDFYLKLHPLDSIENYLILGVEESRILNDFDTAISQNIVLARKSTVLLEAIYSESLPCAVLIDDQDLNFFENEFPSLWDCRIHRAFSFDELCRWLNVQCH